MFNLVHKCKMGKRVQTFKYLGIILDSNSSWSSHTDYLCNKVSSRIGILEHIMAYITLPSGQTVYMTTIQPLFDYCGVVWDTCSKTSSLRVKKLQNHAGRVILTTYMPSSISPLYSKGECTTKSFLFTKRNNQLDTNYIRYSEIHIILIHTI